MFERNFYINLRHGHAIDQFRTRSGAYGWSDRRVEEVMREWLNNSLRARTFLESRKEGEKLCRIAVAGLDVVYVVLEPGRPGGRFQYMCNTVITQEMYQSWTREARIGTLGERIDEQTAKDIQDAVVHHRPVEVKVEAEKKETEESEETMFLIERREDKSWASIKLPESKVSAYVTGLLAKGYSLTDIRIYKPTSFKLSVNIGEE